MREDRGPWLVITLTSRQQDESAEAVGVLLVAALLAAAVISLFYL